MVLSIVSLRLKGLGLALMTLAAALFFDNTIFSDNSITNGQTGLTLKQSWLGPINFFTLSEHAYFILAMGVLTACVLFIIQVRKGTFGRFLSAMRGSDVGAAGLGMNLTWQRILIFALSGAVAGIGGTLLAINIGSANAIQFNYELGLVFVVIVDHSRRHGGGSHPGWHRVRRHPAAADLRLPRFQGLTFVLFAFGALTFASHPEGILEYQKRRSTSKLNKLFAPRDQGSHGSANRACSDPEWRGSDRRIRPTRWEGSHGA